MFKALNFFTLLLFITVSPENSTSPLFSKIRYVKLLLYLLLVFFHLLFFSLFSVFFLFLFGTRIAFRCAAAAAAATTTTTTMATRTFGARRANAIIPPAFKTRPPFTSARNKQVSHSVRGADDGLTPETSPSKSSCVCTTTLINVYLEKVADSKISGYVWTGPESVSRVNI